MDKNFKLVEKNEKNKNKLSTKNEKKEHSHIYIKN